MTDGRIEFLTEKDIEYFQKLAEKGEAVVLTISEEDLLSLDFSRPVPGLEDMEINTQEDLDQWVKKYKEEYRKLYGDNQEGNKGSKKIRKHIEANGSDEEKRITSPKGKRRREKAELDPETKEIVNQAISAGVNEKIINLILQADLTLGEMRNLYKIFSDDKENNESNNS